MTKPKRPWLVRWTSDEWGWNERQGRRFSTEARARAFADRLDGYRDIDVLYNEAQP